MKRVAPNLYVYRGYYYFRWKQNSVPKKVSLRTKSLREAREIAKSMRDDLLAARGPGRGKKGRFKRLSQVLAYYVSAGCPTRVGAKRTGKQLFEETSRINHLERHLGRLDPCEIDISDWNQYVEKRRPEFKRGKGDRALDLEWVALTSAYRVAAKNPEDTGIRHMPAMPKPDPKRLSSDVVHCRDFQPENADELHAIAEHFLMGHTSEVFGWYVLLASMIGQRASEMVKLEATATGPDTPGYDDGKHLHLVRSKTHKGTAPFIEIGPELRECLIAHRSWLKLRHKGTRWFFPSPRDPSLPLTSNAATKALARACRTLDLPKRTSHGLRSYFVNVLRSQGISDADIAARIGHKSAGKIIVETYGEFRPIKIGWTPSTAPAWERFDVARPKVVSAQF